MKKYIKYFIIVIIMLFISITIFVLYQKNNERKLIESKRIAVELDEKEYAGRYLEFVSEQYQEKPKRIIFKKENTNNEFYVFNNGDEEFDRVLKVCEDRMAYSAMEDYNMWSFTPYIMQDVSNSNENFIVFDYDDEIEHKNYTYDIDFNRNIFFRFSNKTRLYRLMDYLSYIYEPVNMEELKEIIGKSDFIPKDQIISGYKYMNPAFMMD